MEDYKALKESCGVSRLPLSIIRIAGNDRAKFVHNFCTADIKKLEPDSCCEAFFLNTKGKTICHGIVICREIDLLVVSTSKTPEVLIENLDRYLLSEDVQITNATSLWRSLFVCGPQSSIKLGESEVRVPPEWKVSNTGFQLALQADLAGPGVLILEPVAGDVNVADKLVANGVVQCSPESIHLMRVVRQTPWCDVDITEKCLPQEFRRDAKAISFTKGCYLGQETVARLDALGHVNRYFTGFEVLEGAIEVGDEVRKDEKKIGVVTSVAGSPEGQKFGIGFLKVKFTRPGETIDCDGVILLIS